MEYMQRKALFEYGKNRRLLVYGVLAVITGVIAILLNELVAQRLGTQYSYIFFIIGSTFLILGVGTLLYRYLQVSSFSRYSNSEISGQQLRSEIQDLRFEVLKLRKKSGGPSNYEDISGIINSAINNTITEEFIKSKIDAFYSASAISEAKRRGLLEDFDNLNYRINGELTRLRKSATLNLIIGALTTACAIVALGYEVFNNELEFDKTTEILAHYIPRISLIIFLEIFAFFFLKLYKTTLSDIKYFNNEKTNIDFKIISLKAAFDTRDSTLIHTILVQLAQTERNFKLGKGESTVELEKVRNDTRYNDVIAHLLKQSKQ